MTILQTGWLFVKAPDELRIENSSDRPAGSYFFGQTGKKVL
jgi:hypothetical protein